MSAAPAQEKLKVVATFSILADFVKNVGGDRVDVQALVGPNSDAHVYQPSPGDAKTLTDAKVIFTNGLGFEGWIARLIKASGTKAPMIVATKGVKPRKAERWSRARRCRPARVAIGREREDLRGEYPRRAHRRRSGRQERLRGERAAYLARLDALDAEVKAAIAKIPADRRKIITTHDAFGYFAAAYGVTFIAPQGVSTEAEVSARDVARIITQIRKQKIPAVFLENVTDDRLLKRIGAESGARIGGTLYSDALTDEKGPAPTYIDMMRHNVKQLAEALMS